MTTTPFFSTLARWRLVCALMLAALLPALAQAQVSQDWMVSKVGAYGRMVAVDALNNAYVVGSVPWSAITLTKYSPTGAALWERSFLRTPGTGVRATWVTVDSAGNPIVTGTIVRSDGLNSLGRIVLKYNAAGTLLWQEVLPANVTGTARVTTDAANNIYVLGTGLSTLDNITMKYAPNGTRLWQRVGNAPVSGTTSMALTPSRNLIVTGNILSAGAVVAYDPAGSQIWARPAVSGASANDVAVGPSGEFVVVGSLITPGVGSAFLVTKYDANFNQLWRRSYSVGQSASKAALDSKGNVIVTGVVGNYLNWMTVKLDPNGTLLWSRTYDQHRANDEIPYFLVVGPDDAAYITGQGGPGPTSGELSYLRTVTLKYAPDGTQAWAATTFDSVRGLAVKLGNDNSLYVVGESPQMLVRYRQTSASNQLPVAVASANKTSGTTPLGVSFSSAGSFDPDGSIIAYEWNFGDGSTSIAPNPYHVYSPGSYAATLKVTDNRFDTATSAPINIKVNVVPPVPSALTVEPASVVGGGTAQGTVTLTGFVGAVVSLRSSNPAVATVPATVVVPAGAQTASFTVQSKAVAAQTAVTITASTTGFITKNATLTVLPPAAR